MHGDRKLEALAARKRLLRSRIEVHRLECLEAWPPVERPLALGDRAWRLWRGVSPWAKAVGLPLALIAARKLADNTAPGKVAMVLRALPVAVAAWKELRGRRGQRDDES